MFALMLCGLAISMATMGAAQAEPPHLIQIVPASGPAGIAYPLRATIGGIGFMPAGNLVQFGPVRIANVASADGFHLTFAVPKLVSSRGEVPPMVLEPGQYPVTVKTASGQSNTLSFTLTREPQ
jgi:hypothetical protein